MRQVAAPLAARVFASAGTIVALTIAAPAFASASPVMASGRAPGMVRTVDDFETLGAWSAHPADGVEMRLSSDVGVHGRALRIDFKFARGAGYAVARRAVNLDLPERYAFDCRVRGACSPNDLEFKLVDSTGANVWWCNRRGFAFPGEWKALSTKRRQISFAWGPAGGGDIRHVAAIEIAITAGTGGEGTVWLDDLELRELPPPQSLVPVASASSSRPGHDAGLAIDADASSSWRSGAGERSPWWSLDFGGDRELGGLVVDWVPGRQPRRYVVESSPDGREWSALRQVEGGGKRDYLYLPETETRFLRFRALRLRAGDGCAIASVEVKPIEWAASPESFFLGVARDAPRGDYPRGIAGEQSYWTVVGRDADAEEGLVSEDGTVEAGKRGFSIEPFLYAGGRLHTWADARITRRLEGGRLPVPVVRWEADSLRLDVTVTAIGVADTAALHCRYQVRNLDSRPRAATLYLAIRPFQVNPPSQFLNTPGGVSPIREIAREGLRVRVNRVRGVVSLQPPSGFGAATFDQGNIVGMLRRGTLPSRERVVDPFGFASGALAYSLDLPAGGERTVSVVASLGPGPPGSAASLGAPDSAAEAQASPEPVTIEGPPAASEAIRTLYAQIGFILVNRDGAAIQPGSRSYERSWIRDGSLTSSALLRMGHAAEVREFIEWFASRQFEDGKIPCCVDSRGPDPVPEHDSHGEFIYLVAEYLRLTDDRALAARMWPHVLAAATYLDSLRRSGRTAEYRAPERREFFGLLPPSISHEGYSARPMHSYWDDFFALRGFQDAADLASTLGHREEAVRWSRVRAEFRLDLHASIRAAMARHRVDYVPGCADLGDFDATSTTIALSPVQAGGAVPAGALSRTFERYWAFFTDRRDGRTSWDAFTPYEIRNIGAFVRLGWRERANALLEFFLAYRRPPGWPQWAEVVWHDERTPHFIGDMPHTWVGSDYVRSMLDMLAYERESDDALVIGAGVPDVWLRGESGVSVRGLRTRYGPLSFAMRATRAGPIPGWRRLSSCSERIEVRVDGVRVPRGGVVIAAPGVGPRSVATVNGVSVPVSTSGEVRVRTLPATIVIERPAGRSQLDG